MRENANLRVYGRLGLCWAVYKKKHPQMLIALCGCMMQEKEVVDKIKKSYRYVDLIFGTHNIFKLAELVSVCLDSRKGDESRREAPAKPTSTKWLWTCGRTRTRSWRICRWSENIPSNPASISCLAATISAATALFPMCGGGSAAGSRRRSSSEISKDWLSEGVVEVMLLGQNVNSYGKNLDDAHDICAASRGKWSRSRASSRIRFMTSHPKDLSEELIQVMAQSDKICRHLAPAFAVGQQPDP